jgi:hypothetical protein
MFSPITKSTWPYLQYLLVLTQVAAGWCLGWVETEPWFTQRNALAHIHKQQHELKVTGQKSHEKEKFKTPGIPLKPVLLHIIIITNHFYNADLTFLTDVKARCFYPVHIPIALHEHINHNKSRALPSHTTLLTSSVALNSQAIRYKPTSPNATLHHNFRLPENTNNIWTAVMLSAHEIYAFVTNRSCSQHNINSGACSHTHTHTQTHTLEPRNELQK